MKPKNRIALVTGSARGIGFGIARALAEKGHHILLNDLEDPEAVRDRMEEIGQLGVRAAYCKADVSSSPDRQRLVETAVREFGTIHVLVNNAGVAPRVRSDILDANEESYDRVMGINLKGPYFLTQAVARLMLEGSGPEQDPRYILFVTSINAITASVNRGEYSISKAGLSMASTLWSVRLADQGIYVYEIRPGIIRTDMTKTVTEKYDRLIAEGLIPENRWGTPEDVGRAAAALVSGAFDYSTGQIVYVDGGQMIHRL